MSSNIYPLSYGICDEDIIPYIPDKHHIWAEIIPGFSETYRFGPDDESSYKDMYRSSRFAFTWKKGGWDSLRHYEILANGCIPCFRDLDQCPRTSLTTFPKTLLKNAMNELLPWKESESYKQNYQEYLKKLLDHMRKSCTTSAMANYVLSILPLREKPKVLFLTGNIGVNYTREFLFIGLNRLCKSLGGECIMHPQLPFLYNDCKREDIIHKHGMGYGYSKKLNKTLHSEINPPSDSDIQRSIESKHWDFIVYGKTGPDEGREGSIPDMPYWNHVFTHYTSDTIVFLYGGDGCQSMKHRNHYFTHLEQHSKYGHCFVRELDM